MAVPTEQFQATDLAENGVRTSLVGVRRQAAGGWFATLEVAGVVTLPDGRQVDIKRTLTARMNQQLGRKNARRTA